MIQRANIFGAIGAHLSKILELKVFINFEVRIEIFKSAEGGET